MKINFLALALVIILTGCERISDDTSALKSDEQPATSSAVKDGKNFTFHVKGDFGAASFSRAALEADGKSMTDLWALDYMDGKLVQQIHQTPDSASWGAPRMKLGYGSHHVYFIASRGGEPSLNTDEHEITWGDVRDTFWKDYAIDVSSTSNGNRAVTLGRVATKLVCWVEDQIPSTATTVSMVPSTWYFGLDYMSGEPVSAENKGITGVIPASVIGTSGQLNVNLFGISGKDEWTTDVTLSAFDGSGTTIGSVVIKGVPLKRNRVTSYRGNLFSADGAIGVTLDHTWEAEVNGEW